jgi:hypothetical protein
MLPLNGLIYDHCYVGQDNCCDLTCDMNYIECLYDPASILLRWDPNQDKKFPYNKYSIMAIAMLFLPQNMDDSP